jgi:hypothetical protein
MAAAVNPYVYLSKQAGKYGASTPFLTTAGEFLYRDKSPLWQPLVKGAGRQLLYTPAQLPAQPIEEEIY